MSTLEKFGTFGMFLLLLSSLYFMYIETKGETRNISANTTNIEGLEKLNNLQLKQQFPYLDLSEFNFHKTTTITYLTTRRLPSIFPPKIEKGIYEIEGKLWDDFSVKTIGSKVNISWASLMFMLSVCFIAIFSGYKQGSNNIYRPVTMNLLLIAIIFTFFFSEITILATLFPSASHIYFITIISILTAKIIDVYKYREFFYQILITVQSLAIALFVYIMTASKNAGDSSIILELILFGLFIIILEYMPLLREKFKDLKAQTIITT